MRNLNSRIENLESIVDTEQLPVIKRVMIDCACQVKHREKFREIETEKNVYRLEPIDSDFNCTCHVQRNRL